MGIVLVHKAKCSVPECSTEFALNGSNVVKKKFRKGDRSIWLTYYDCPKCGRRYFVQADNEESNLVLQVLTGLLGKQMAQKRKGHAAKKKQQAKFEETRKHLSSIRNKLQSETTGQLVHDDETGEDFEVEFDGCYG